MHHLELWNSDHVILLNDLQTTSKVMLPVGLDFELDGSMFCVLRSRSRTGVARDGTVHVRQLAELQLIGPAKTLTANRVSQSAEFAQVVG